MFSSSPSLMAPEDWVPCDSKGAPLPMYPPVLALRGTSCYPTKGTDPAWAYRNLRDVYEDEHVDKLWPSIRALWQYRSVIGSGQDDPAWCEQVMAWLVSRVTEIRNPLLTPSQYRHEQVCLELGVEPLRAVLEFADGLVQREVFEASVIPSFAPPPAPPTPLPTNPLSAIKPKTRAVPRQKLVPIPVLPPKTTPPPILVEGSSDEVEEADQSAGESQASQPPSKRPRKSSPKEQPAPKKAKKVGNARTTETLRKQATRVIDLDLSNQTVSEGDPISRELAKTLPLVGLHPFSRPFFYSLLSQRCEGCSKINHCTRIWRLYYKRWPQVCCVNCQSGKTGCSLTTIFFERPPKFSKSTQSQAPEDGSQSTSSASPMRKSISEGARLDAPVVTRSSARTAPPSPQTSSSPLASIEHFHQVLEDESSSEFRLREFHANLRGAWRYEQVRREILEARDDTWQRLDTLFLLRLSEDRDPDEDQSVAGPSQPRRVASSSGRSPQEEEYEHQASGSAGEEEEEEVRVRRPKKAMIISDDDKGKGRAGEDDV